MIQDALKVRMLGGFTLEYRGREIILDRNIASKTMQLLQIMLLHTGGRWYFQDSTDRGALRKERSRKQKRQSE